MQKKIGPAWSERAAGRLLHQAPREVWLQDLLHDARRGTLPGVVQSGVRFAEAAEEGVRFIKEDRERKPSTLVDHRSALNAHLLPACGDWALESITPAEIEKWRRSLTGLSEKHPMRPSGDIQVFSPEEVWALVRAAASERGTWR